MPHVEQTRFAAGVAILLAAAACLLLPVAPAARLVAAGGLALAALLAFVRYRGRRLPGWVLARIRFRRRTRRWHGHRPRWPIGAVVPGPDTRAHVDRAGNRVGVLAEGPAWTTILRLDPIPEGMLVDRLTGLLDHLARVPAASDVPVDAVQLVGWSVPAAGRQPPVLRAFWVAARFLPDRHRAAVDARGGGEEGAVRAAAVAALRLATSLRQQGYGLRVLDGTELTDELGTSLGLEPARRGTGGAPLAAPGRVPAAREGWRSWSLGALHHACFRVRRPPRQRARLAALFTVLARPPAVTTCVSVLYARAASGARTPGPEVVVRLAVPAGRDARAVRHGLRQASAGLRARLTPMNGEHLAGVRATIPLATSP